GGGSQLRLERLLEDRGLENDSSFFEENLGQLTGRLDVVKAAVALAGYGDHRLWPSMARDEHPANRNPVFHDYLHQIGRRRARIPVAKDDDVFEIGRRFLEALVRLGHQALETGQVALVHTRYLASQFPAVAFLGHGEQPPLRAVPKEHSDLV